MVMCMGPYYGGWIFPPFIMFFMMAILCFFLWRRGGISCCTPWQHSDNRNFYESAIEILNKKYVKGEVTREEYERMKADILG